MQLRTPRLLKSRLLDRFTGTVILSLLVIGLGVRLLSSQTLLKDNINLLMATQYVFSYQNVPDKSPFITACYASTDENITFLTSMYETGQACASLSFSRAACLAGGRARAEQWFDQARQSCDRQELLLAWGGLLAWTSGDRQEALDQWHSLPRGGAQYLAYLVDQVPSEDVTARRYLLEKGLLPQAHELGPAQIQKYYTLLASIYRQEGNWPQMASLYEEAVGLAPANAVLWIRLGDARRLTGDLVEARKAYETALGLGLSLSLPNNRWRTGL